MLSRWTLYSVRYSYVSQSAYERYMVFHVIRVYSSNAHALHILRLGFDRCVSANLLNLVFVLLYFKSTLSGYGNIFCIAQRTTTPCVMFDSLCAILLYNKLCCATWRDLCLKCYLCNSISYLLELYLIISKVRLVISICWNLSKSPS